MLRVVSSIRLGRVDKLPHHARRVRIILEDAGLVADLFGFPIGSAQQVLNAVGDGIADVLSQLSGTPSLRGVEKSD
jgi:hypothetical protein